MSARRRLAVFGIGLGAIFAAALGVGSLAEPADTTSGSAHAESGGHERGSEDEVKGHGGHGEASDAPAGLAVAEGGYSLRLERAFFEDGDPAELRFAIVDPSGEAVRSFDREHERRMHLIVVRRDGSGFQHLHPEMDATGTWSTTTRLATAGAYRLFADFSVEGSSLTLASDLFVSGGEFRPAPFPDPSPVEETDGYAVELDSHEPLAGAAAELAFTVERDGRLVEDLDPYLGAKGHLVALREGDLAFLHVHPEEAGHGHGAEGIAFAATFPTPGRYRLYLQFKHEGAVRTAEFTVEVAR